uniref:MARVEL domain-containing protein n=1 Tax=Fusarium oxysporum (strain Fo5176) TaxID=660025 RepID=A0A0D2XS32_FUSOF
MVGTGVAHKVISILLRLGELASAIIVLGILSRFCYLISIAEVYADGRIIYGIVVACLGIIYSFIFCPPFKNMFLGFPFDFVMFVMWLVAYCLLQTRTGGHACSGVYVFRTYIRIDETKREIRRQAEKLTKGDSRAHGYNQRAEEENGATNNV